MMKEMRIIFAMLIISLLILGGCKAGPPVGPELSPDVQSLATPPAADIPSAGSTPVPEPPRAPDPVPAPIPAPVTPDPGPADGPGANEIWIVDNAFVPSVITVSEGITVSLINKNSYPVTILPSPSGSNGAVYTDPKTNLITINGANFNNVLPPGGSTSITLVTGGAFILYLENDPAVTGTILVGG